MARRALPSLNALRAFEAAARLGRMTAAAGELGVTHGAVSRQVRHLEEVLGVRLFEGPRNRPSLTEAGGGLLPHLSAAFDRIEAAVRDASASGAGMPDVSCPGTLTMRWLIPRLHRFRASNPRIEVRLGTSRPSPDLWRERHRVAIWASEGALPGDVVATELFVEAVGPVLSPALAQGLRLARPEDIAAFPILHTRTRRDAWAAWAERVGWRAAELDGAEFEHFYFMLEGATSGLGAAIAPWPLVIDDVRAGRLVAPFGFAATSRTYVAVRQRRPDPAAQAFCAWLRAEAEATPRPPA